MDKELKLGPMELNILENTKMEKNMDKEYSSGLMELFMKENLQTII